jgi:hypothetical protein
MICEQIKCITGLIGEIETCEDADVIRRKSALVLHSSVLAVEIFFNIYFYVMAKYGDKTQHLAKIIKDLDSFAPLDRKFKTWPKLMFGKEIRIDTGIGEKFMKAKNERNSLMHYQHTDHSFISEYLTIHGLTDTLFYNSLNSETSKKYYWVALDTIGEVFRIQGKDETAILHEIHKWAGVILW